MRINRRKSIVAKLITHIHYVTFHNEDLLGLWQDLAVNLARWPVRWVPMRRNRTCPDTALMCMLTEQLHTEKNKSDKPHSVACLKSHFQIYTIPFHSSSSGQWQEVWCISFCKFLIHRSNHSWIQSCTSHLGLFRNKFLRLKLLHDNHDLANRIQWKLQVERETAKVQLIEFHLQWLWTCCRAALLTSHPTCICIQREIFILFVCWNHTEVFDWMQNHIAETTPVCWSNVTHELHIRLCKTGCIGDRWIQLRNVCWIDEQIVSLDWIILSISRT